MMPAHCAGLDASLPQACLAHSMAQAATTVIEIPLHLLDGDPAQPAPA
jgi:hypothetical protein